VGRGSASRRFPTGAPELVQPVLSVGSRFCCGLVIRNLVWFIRRPQSKPPATPCSLCRSGRDRLRVGPRSIARLARTVQLIWLRRQPLRLRGFSDPGPPLLAHVSRPRPTPTRHSSTMSCSGSRTLGASALPRRGRACRVRSWVSMISRSCAVNHGVTMLLAFLSVLDCPRAAARSTETRSHRALWWPAPSRDAVYATYGC